MGRKSKVLFEVKIDIVQRCLAGKTTANYEALLLGIHPKSIANWIALYQSQGENGLITRSKNVVYSLATKRNAVEDYLHGKGSLIQICKKYHIRSQSQLQNWIKKYNNHEELKASGTGGKPIMIKRRKTTYEERITIVQYCIENQNNYTETADKFQVSYQQVYTWMKKYEELGIDGLLDRRGRTKPVEEMSELERLHMENRLLKAQNKRQEMEMNFLKKLDEIERRWD
ncbi:MAG: helix-turn-helix domain-containing protein [Cellulosilyticaceae bacterium]